MANNQDLFDLFHRKLREMWFAEKKISPDMGRLLTAIEFGAVDPLAASH
jgi:ferritin-like metal-binding protein YciE